MTCWISILVGVLVATQFSTSAIVSAGQTSSIPPGDYLFSITATEGSFDGTQLAFKGVPLVVIFPIDPSGQLAT